MKKFILLAFAIGAFSFTSCSSDDDAAGNDCTQLNQDVQTSQAAYAQEQNTANCQAFKAALRASLDAGCASGEQQTNYEAMYNGLPCE